MFTGIVEETATIRDVQKDDDGRRLRLDTSFDDLSVGQSISVSGACLTVEAFGEDWFEVFLATETVDRTYLGAVGPGDELNVERALPADGRFDGHFVQGHVDGTGEVREIEQLGDDWRFTFSLPDDLSQYVVEKGSIAIDGISLTVAALDETTMDVAIIPETYDLTTLSEKEPGDPVHLEVDVVAKYVEQLVDGYQ
jgi:riboflavin synthase